MALIPLNLSTGPHTSSSCIIQTLGMELVHTYCIQWNCLCLIRKPN